MYAAEGRTGGVGGGEGRRGGRERGVPVRLLRPSAITQLCGGGSGGSSSTSTSVTVSRHALESLSWHSSTRLKPCAVTLTNCATAGSLAHRAAAALQGVSGSCLMRCTVWQSSDGACDDRLSRGRLSRAVCPCHLVEAPSAQATFWYLAGSGGGAMYYKRRGRL